MVSTVIAGKPSNTVGEKNSTLILRGSSVKIQWGNKFIDLVKNGKINVEADKILKTANTVEEITTDGIYLIDESIWVVIGGTKVQLAGDTSTTYVSYLTVQETTPEQKKQALTNIGFYYDTYEQAQSSGLTSGIIYVQGDNKLYVVKEGILSEYLASSTTAITKDTPIQNIIFSEYSLLVDNEEYINYRDNTISISKPVILEEELSSKGATDQQGYRLYTQYGQSYLEIDNLIVRNQKSESININPIKYYQEENIILNAENNEGVVSIHTLKSDKYEVGDILFTNILTTNETNEQVLIEVMFIIDRIVSNSTYIVTLDIEDTYIKSIILQDVSSLINKIIYFKQGSKPVVRIQDNNYDLFNSEEEQSIENINTRIGSLKGIQAEVLGEIKEDILGIYSNNSILENSTIVKAQQFGSTFKPISATESLNNYPIYDESLKVPTDVENTDFNQAIPNIAWIKQLIDVMIPKGTIVMWNGTTIPKGWAICNGTNGTPNLIGKFIKADNTAGSIGGSNTVTLNVENLPNHTHTISELTTSSNVSNTHSHSIPGQNITSSAASTSKTVWKTIPRQEDFDKMSDLTTVKGTNLKSLSVGNIYLDTTSESPTHLHTINIPTVTSSSEEEKNHTHTIGSHSTSGTTDAKNTTINIQPEYYSLIFIIKI